MKKHKEILKLLSKNKKVIRKPFSDQYNAFASYIAIYCSDCKRYHFISELIQLIEDHEIS